MIVTVFGATSPTGRWVCEEAIRAGHEVRAVSRRRDPLPLEPSERWTQVLADAESGEGVAAAVAGADAVLSVLGTAYSRHPIRIYSAGTRHIIEGLRAGGRGKRLVVVSSGLTYPPPSLGWFPDHVVFPILRHVLGRTLYADMRRMEEEVRACDDLDWTIMRPGKLYDADQVSDYRIDLDHPTRNDTSRPDLAAAMVAELAHPHLRQAVSPTSDQPSR